MSIEHIQGLGAYEMNKLSRHQKAKVQAAHKSEVKDTFESSKTPDSEERKKLLETVAKRVKSGYYNSADVVDDLGESFAKIFDKLL